MMEFLFERVVAAYRGGEQVTLDVGERDGYVVIGLTLVGGIDATRACLLEPADASALVQALDQAISRANAKREGN